MEQKKYVMLEDDSIEFNGRTLYRILAVRSFGDVKGGDKGGYIEKESNLSHYGDCWVYDYGKVCDGAVVCNDAKVRNKAIAHGNSYVASSSELKDYGEAGGKSKLFGNSKVCGDAYVGDNVTLRDSAEVGGRSYVLGDTRIAGSVKVGGEITINGNLTIGGDAVIREEDDYIVFKNWWSCGRYFAWTRSNNKWSLGMDGIFTSEELIAEGYEESEQSGRNYERIVRFLEATLQEEATN